MITACRIRIALPSFLRRLICRMGRKNEEETGESSNLQPFRADYQRGGFSAGPRNGGPFGAISPRMDLNIRGRADSSTPLSAKILDSVVNLTLCVYLSYVVHRFLAFDAMFTTIIALKVLIGSHLGRKIDSSLKGSKVCSGIPAPSGGEYSFSSIF